MHRHQLLAGFVLLLALPALAQQQGIALTLEDALERARQSAPPIVSARMRIDETRFLPLRANPTMELEVGRRTGAASSTDYGIEVARDIDLPQRRRARIAAARAGVRQEEQRAAEIERGTLREVATAFLRALEARERAGVAASARRLAEDALHIAERRYAAGDVAQLDVNLARTAVARADAGVRTAHAELTAQTTELQVLLGITEPLAIAGSLRDALAMPASSPTPRADMRLLEAEIAGAESERRLAQQLRWPDVGFRAAHRREEGDRILLGGIGLTLPFFDRGRQATAIAGARLTRLRAERDALARTIETEIRGSVASLDALRAAAAEYERTVLPLVEENERLALESYEVGQIGLAGLLLVRSDALDARRAFLDQLIELRLAEVELRARTGAWQ